MSHKLTAIVPVYNGSDVLHEAIASIRAQTRAVDELIVVDDASTDESAEIARALGATVIRFDGNRGPSAARNAGLRRASGDVIAFLDADDTWAPRHCELLLAALDACPGAVLLTSRTQLVSPVDRDFPAPPANVAFDPLPYLVRYNFVTQSAVIVRRDAILQSGGYDETMRFSEDYRLWLTLGMQHDFIYVPAVTVTRRVHAGQATWQNDSPLFDATWRLRLALLADEGLRRSALRHEKVLEALRQAAMIDYRLTWQSLDRASFDIVDHAVAQVPGAESVRRHWRWRRRMFWHVWRATVLGVRSLRSLYRRSPLRA